MKYLIFGAGYLGKQFSDFLDDSILSEKRINSKEDIISEIEKYNPKIVINCIGKTGNPNVDWCEEHKEMTTFSNVELPYLMAISCQELDKRLVHIGSGCIYEGNDNFTELDEPNFRGSHYSKTKILSEKILSNYPVLTLRIRMPIDGSPKPQNLLTKILSYPTVVDCQNSMTYIPEFLNATLQLMENKCTGIFNMVNGGTISPFEIVKRYHELKGDEMKTTALTPKQLDDITSARRSNCIISNNKLKEIVPSIRNISEVVDICITEYIENEKEK